MTETCSNCNKETRAGSKFCGSCGTPIKPKERRCNKCNELLEAGENFCPMCGEKYIEVSGITLAPMFTIQKEKDLTAGTLVNLSDSSTLRFKTEISESVNKVIKDWKKKLGNSRIWSDKIFLYHKDEEVVFIRDNSNFIESYSYYNTKTPLRKYTVSDEVDKIWESALPIQRYGYFFKNQDAFFAWDDYIFLSVYEGKIAWIAADSRDIWRLPNEQADTYIYKPGLPEIEFLDNGNIKCEHFYNNAECKLVKGVITPI